MDHYVVKDEDRELTFDGQLLASSTSQNDKSVRWVTFQLYRTAGGMYVVSRTGFSLVYHDADCKQRKRLVGAPAASLGPQATPCTECRPVADIDQAHETVYPEQPLYWAVAVETPAEVIESLTKRDANGLSYLTHVARNLIRAAALSDPELSDCYFTERVS